MKLSYGIIIIFLLSCSSNEECEKGAPPESLKVSTYPDSVIRNRPTSNSLLIAKREFQTPYHFIWRDQIERINDPTFISAIEKQKEYGLMQPSYGLLDFNKDGYKDLFFEYYGLSGAGVKNRVSVYFYLVDSTKFSESAFQLTNPAYYYNLGIITSHYRSISGVWAEKLHVHNGIIDTLEVISGKHFFENENFRVELAYSQTPFNDTVYVSDTMSMLPIEYDYESIIFKDDSFQLPH